MNLGMSFIIVNSLVLFGILYTDETYISNYNLLIPSLIHILCIISFFFGYILLKNKYKISDKTINISNSYYIFSYLLIFIGLLITFIQLKLTYSFVEYLDYIIDYKNNNTDVRSAFLRSSKDGGLDGLLRVFTSTILSVFLMTSSIIYYYDVDSLNKKKLFILLIFAFLSLILKSFISLDKMSLMAVLFTLFFLLIKKYNNLFIYLVLLIIIYILDFISRLRFNGFGLIETTLLYFKLNLTNFGFIIDSYENFTYGFSSILSPVVIFFKYFGFEFLEPSVYKWEWNPALYGFSLFFLDFSYFIFIVVFLLGIFTKYFEIMSNHLKKKYSITFFSYGYCLLSFIVIPAFCGPEFWVIIFINLLISNTIKIK